jgi:hypothetical protein
MLKIAGVLSNRSNNNYRIDLQQEDKRFAYVAISIGIMGLVKKKP